MTRTHESRQIHTLLTMLGASAAIALGATGSALAGGGPVFRALGSLPGTNASWGYGVSDDGSVVVGRSGTNFYYGNSGHAYRSTRTGPRTAFPPMG
jgi:uncharacterized membrane protein